MSELIKQLNEKSSLGKLEKNTKTLPSDRDGNSDRVQVSNIIFIPYLNEKRLLVKAKAKTQKNLYNTAISFNNVKFINDEPLNTISFIAVDGEEYNIKPLILNTDNAKVNCTCLDFYYTFSVWNDNDDSLEAGTPKPYVKKTNRPPRNPPKVPGMCKHLLKMVDVLKAKGLIK
jgi:hypothetical protein